MLKRAAILLLIQMNPGLKAQHDNVLEALDSLSGIFYFNKINYDQGSNQYNYPKGYSPKFTENEYRERVEALDKNSPFKFVYNSIVRKYIDNYIRAPKSVATIISNSKYYFPLYENYLIKYEIPLELKYLSVIESALNPTAKSYCGAAGLWQFMPATGKAYGLSINSYVDQRYNVEMATDAACRYLKDLYTIYGDWSLAIAAYNCGAGNVNKAIKWSRGKKDFFSIMEYLPKETQGYVPAFMAATYIINYWEIHNMPLADTKIFFSDIDNIVIDREISLLKLASLLKMDVRELRYFNPAYYTGVIPGNGDKITVTKDKAMAFIDILKETQGSTSMTQPIKDTSQSTKVNVSTPGTGTNNSTAPLPSEQKSPFGTIRNSNILQKSAVTLPTKAQDKKVWLCELINDFKIKTDAICKVRILSDLETGLPKNSLLEGKLIYKEKTPVIYFYKVLNSNKSIGYYYPIEGNLKEGETIYLTN